MEIQQGKGPWASPVAGIVPLGTTLTMVVGIDDKQGKKRVARCDQLAYPPLVVHISCTYASII